jgi:hypothetical protein
MVDVAAGILAIAGAAVCFRSRIGTRLFAIAIGLACLTFLNCQLNPIAVLSGQAHLLNIDAATALSLGLVICSFAVCCAIVWAPELVVGSRPDLVLPLIVVLAAMIPDMRAWWGRPPLIPIVAPSLKFVAAYQPPAHTLIAGRLAAVEWVEWKGLRYQLDQDDFLTLDKGDIAGVRVYRSPPGVLIELASKAGWRMFERTKHRMSQLDAVFANGHLLTVVPYESFSIGTIPFFWKETGPQQVQEANALASELVGE